jgi:hypothetical protein
MRILCAIALLALTGCAASYSRGGNEGTEGDAAVLLGDTDSSSTDDVGLLIDIKEESPVLPGMTRANVLYAVEVSNYTAEPLKVVRIMLQSQGSNAAQLAPLTSSRFKKVIPPREKAELEMMADFAISDANVGLDAPMLLRATVEFEQGETKKKAFFTRRVGRGAVSIRGPRRN